MNMIEQKYLDLLRELTADQSPHSGRTLLEHLTGTYDLLESWGNSHEVCVAGLFHSIYGTQYYTVQSTSLADRQRIAEVIGSRAEELAFLFCTTDRMSFVTQAAAPAPKLVVTKTGQPVPVSQDVLGELIEIEAANRIEQFAPETVSPELIEAMTFMLKAGDRHMTLGAKQAFARALAEYPLEEPQASKQTTG